MQLAIVIPYFKKQYFLECIESLAVQTNKNFTVYIGDDASPEEPLEIIKGFEGSLNIFYHRFSENLGGTSLTGQWHRCINLSAGERWLMILGDDDYISENYVEEFYKNLKEVEERNIKVVRFASRVVRSPSGDISRRFEHPKIEKSTNFVYRRYFEGSRGSLTEQIFRRDMFLKYGFSDIPLGWGSDILAWMQFSEFGNNFSINTATAFFRISDYNISRGGYLEEQKMNARIIFFSHYLLANLEAFEPAQKIRFIKLFEEILYKQGKLSIKYWIQLSKLLLKGGKPIQFLKFNRRVFLYVVKNHNSFTIIDLVNDIFFKIRLQLYRFKRSIFRQLETWRKTEFERRIWKRQQLFFGSDLKKELSDFRFYRNDDFETWKNSTIWQHRLENKLNAKEFALKAGAKVAKKIWSGCKEDFQKLDLLTLPENFIIKPVRGEASKDVFLIRGGYNLFDKKKYSISDLEKAVHDLFMVKRISEIVIEEFLPNESGEILVPNDYRFYTFNGNILFIQLDKRKSFEKEQVSFYDENWNLIKEKVVIDAVTNKSDDAPACLSEMVIQAKKLSKHYKIFGRIDFYATQKGAVFGEFTPTPRRGKSLTKFGNKKLIDAWNTYCTGMI
ncbi:ATP-grasp fold amidoligase family protein [Autumnicola psychrophila]|uniref:ATP-grasp fold amidoligase family protein n=1 Tax=Autumnicola psychrophila TaxID=3075592 RepID=A0ABU3DT17_9FLAO|nr:ATP-grasp fold amidoligase family protein [Zunongwangia sp. F225]MDT0686861.1 ATP-grasp fold amidoligase family protein [Zunongwangia sp. F225]